jgi:hypothetical protein
MARSGRRNNDRGLVKLGKSMAVPLEGSPVATSGLDREADDLDPKVHEFAHAHRKYLAENRPSMFRSLARQGRLDEYFHSVGLEAFEAFERLVAFRSEHSHLKDLGFLERLRLLGAIRREAEEVVLNDFVFQPREDSPYED